MKCNYCQTDLLIEKFQPFQRLNVSARKCNDCYTSLGWNKHELEIQENMGLNKGKQFKMKYASKKEKLMMLTDKNSVSIREIESMFKALNNIK